MTRRCCRQRRFDRQVVIPLPNLAERAAMLAVHCQGKRLGPGADLGVVARGTPGFSGADLANLANEATIVAAGAGREVLTAADFEQARDRILLSRREGSNVLRPEEKHAVAVHEGVTRWSLRCPGTVTRSQGDDPARRAGSRGD